MFESRRGAAQHNPPLNLFWHTATGWARNLHLGGTVLPTLVGLVLVVLTSAVFTVLLAGPGTLRTLFASPEPAGASRVVTVHDVVPTVGAAPVSRQTLEPLFPGQVGAPRTPPSVTGPVQIKASSAEAELPIVSDAVDRAAVAQAVAPPRTVAIVPPVVIADAADRQLSAQSGDAVLTPDDAADTADEPSRPEDAAAMPENPAAAVDAATRQSVAVADATDRQMSTPSDPVAVVGDGGTTADDVPTSEDAATDPTPEPPPTSAPAAPVVRQVAAVPAARPTLAPVRAVTRPVAPAPVPAQALLAAPTPTKAPFVAPVRP